jgi:putative membrane protein
VDLEDRSETGDATRRTLLATERTYLAWWRTGLTAFAVSLAAAKIVPELADVTRWPYALLGVGFALLGVLCVGYGERRRREVERAVRDGRFVPTHDGIAVVLAVGGVVLGLIVAVLALTDL